MKNKVEIGKYVWILTEDHGVRRETVQGYAGSNDERVVVGDVTGTLRCVVPGEVCDVREDAERESERRKNADKWALVGKIPGIEKELARLGETLGFEQKRIDALEAGCTDIARCAGVAARAVAVAAAGTSVDDLTDMIDEALRREWR